MAEEIERKFLVRSEGWRAGVTRQTHIVQGYLSSNAKATVRVRILGEERSVVTIKGPVEDLARAEFEYPIPLEDARQMLEIAQPHVVSKTRHIVPHAGLIWEVDVFDGAHAGLVIAEVELDRADRVVELPDWAGKEVSHDDRYANASLSRNPGVPDPE